jgi:uncharacterized protein
MDYAMSTSLANAAVDVLNPVFRIQELLTPAAFAHAVTDLRLEETHISWVVLTGEYAYKIKKPVHYEFIDASTLERRRALCEEELRLNQRVAAGLYVDVVPIARYGVGLRVGGAGPPVEYAVRMRQFPASDELSNRLARNAVGADDLAPLGTRIADFHRRAAVAGADSTYGDLDHVRDQILGNLGLLLASLSGEEDVRTLGRLTDWTNSALAALEPLIRLRKSGGFVRECHGDLHARNIVRWRDEWTPFDCLEFDPALRSIDVMNDVAFLFMDLLAHQRADLGYAFLSRYLEESGDYDGLRLLSFYAVYRALVRAKVDALAAQTATPEAARELRERLAERVRTAARFTSHGDPALIIMHGVSASGKSRLSEALVSAIPALRIRSDLERKRLTGTAPLSHRRFAVRSGAYDDESTNRTYARLLECAESALESGCSVVVDAAFLRRAQRDMFQVLARHQRCPFLIVSLKATAAALAARMAQRLTAATDPSEATSAVLEHQLKTQEPLNDLERSHAVEIDTSPATATAVDVIKARLARVAQY